MIISMIFSLITKIPVQGVAISKAKKFIRPFFISRKDQPPYGSPFCFPSFSNIKKGIHLCFSSVIVVNVCQRGPNSKAKHKLRYAK